MTQLMPTIEELSMFCKRKGLMYASSEIYGGLAGLYDYGHTGTLLKHNFEKLWRVYFLGLADNYYEIEASEIMHENTFVASGHLKNFIDPVALCKNKHVERADHALERKTGKRFEGMNKEELIKLMQEHKVLCLTCGNPIVNIEVINMMFPLNMGVGQSTRAFLRPETAQSPYVNFKRQLDVMRKKLPLGLAVIGRAYRNEISPRNFVLRQRAFTQAELQIFFNPSLITEHDDFASVAKEKIRVMFADSRDKGVQELTCQELAKKLPKFYVYHMAKVQQFYLNEMNIPHEKFRLYELNEKERAFYNKYHFDIELELETWTEVGGIHYRTDHDLKGHQEVSKQNMEFVDDETKERFIPHVLELSFGVDRNVYSLIHLGYTPDKERENTVLRIKPSLAPFTAGVFPLLSNKPELVAKAEEVHSLLKKGFVCIYDQSGSIGRRYARQDELGTPYCIAIDFDSLNANDVTIRNRDNTTQIRVPIAKLVNTIQKLLEGKEFEKAGKIVQKD